MVTNPKQELSFTAVPRGLTSVGSGYPAGSLRVGVRMTIRLSYDEGTGATLGNDFKDFLDWPKGGLEWLGTFDGGSTWVEPLDVLWNSDQAFWSAAFHGDLRVDSKPAYVAAPVRPVEGYPLRRIATELKAFHTREAITASPLGGELLRYVYPDLVQLGATGAAPAADPTLVSAVDKFMTFYRQGPGFNPIKTGEPPRGELSPDFHQRISLVADHGPLLERLGLVLELVFPPRSVKSTRIAVTASMDGVQTERAIVPSYAYTRVNHTPGQLFAALPQSTDLDERLRLKLNDGSRFEVHDVDVDASLIAAFGIPRFEVDGPAPLPPAPRSTGLVITQDDTAAAVRTRLGNARTTRNSLGSATKPSVYADGLIQGYDIQVRRGLGPWLGLCNRTVTYTASGPDAERRFTATGVAPVSTGARVKENTRTLEVSDVLARWDGWSLAVERPGRYQLQEDASTGDVVDTPGTFPGGTIDLAAALPTDPALRLPVLRFGDTYQFRARAIDVTGFGHDWTGAPASAAVTYYRHDPVACPLVLPSPTLTRTETSLRMVVRSSAPTPLNVYSHRTLVPARTSVEMALAHGMLDVDGAPDPTRFEQIARLDETAPPKNGPAPTDAATPAPAVVDWMPDPLSTQVGVSLVPLRVLDVTPIKSASFLPAGAGDDTGKDVLGEWQSVALRLKAIPNGSSTIEVTSVAGHAVVTVSVPAGQVRKIRVRGLPPMSQFEDHGLVQWLDDGFLGRKDRVYKLGYEQMCPSTEVTLVHAIQRPISVPSWNGCGVVRGTSEKDTRIVAHVQHRMLATGRLTILASWSETRDEGGFVRTSKRHRPPEVLTVVDSAIGEMEVPYSGSAEFAQVSVPGKVVAPDLRRRDVTLRIVATGRYLEEFRQPLSVTWSTVPGVDGRVLDLPPGVDLESVRLLRGGRDLVRTTDYRLVADPRAAGKKALALTPGKPDIGITVLGVNGPVVYRSNTIKEVLPAAMRPLPPEVAYVIPAWGTGTTGPFDGIGRARAERTEPRVRIWLERPWWSSGAEEKLAVIYAIDPSPSTTDTQGAAKLVTVFGRDPVYAGPGDDVRDTPWTSEPITGTRYPDWITLDEGLKTARKVMVRLHTVEYDDERDLYYTDVAWPATMGNHFVRMAVARFQEHVTPGNSQLSLIRTIDPIKLLPARSIVASNTGATQFYVRMSGRSDKPASNAELPRLRVSLQKKIVSGDPDLGWDTVAHEEVVQQEGGIEPGYPYVYMNRPVGPGTFRILVEEYEPWATHDASGGLVNNTYKPLPDTPIEAMTDLSGRRPVWVANLQLPQNEPE
ncbi:hypothetical protein [Nocardioides stalactiti]|uniref:hypothetical protein n=1 Tax=Nocardioides stalactiti TaxID=2755356 RepID=UPI0016011711|nr:hypothetical protein [Nocardioides stalactiti]